MLYIQMDVVLNICRAALAKTNIREPRIPVISNVDAQPHSDPDTIKDILARQVRSPVSLSDTGSQLCIACCCVVQSSPFGQVGIACSTEQFTHRCCTHLIKFLGLLRNSKRILL